MIGNNPQGWVKYLYCTLLNANPLMKNKVLFNIDNRIFLYSGMALIIANGINELIGFMEKGNLTLFIIGAALITIGISGKKKTPKKL